MLYHSSCSHSFSLFLKNASMSVLSRFHCSSSFSCYLLSLLFWCHSRADTFPSCWLSSQPQALWAQGVGGREGWVERRGGGGGGGGGGGARGSHIRPQQPITCEGKELANRFYNGTLHTVTQYHKPLSSPTLLLYYSTVAWKSTCDVRKCANTQPITNHSPLKTTFLWEA